MIIFWIMAGLLIVFALCYVLPPLLRRVETTENERRLTNVSIYRDQFAELDEDLRHDTLDQEQYEQGRLELQRRLLEDVASEDEVVADAPAVESQARSGRTAAMMLGVTIPLLAVLLYLLIGSPQALSPERQQQQQSLASQSGETSDSGGTGMSGQPSQEEIEKRVAGLAARLKENPNDAQGWTMLGRSYKAFGRYREASEAYARAAELTGNDARLWVDYAEALALANGSSLEGQPLEIIKKALQIDPNEQKALWLAGNAAFQMGDFRQAIVYWQKLEKLLPEGSEAARSVADSIAEAQQRASGK